MKLVTRYLLGHFRRPWIYVLAGFSIVVVLVDLFGNFVDFMEAETSLRQILQYYAILLPTFLPYLLPVSLLLALLYALWQLGKSSELVALRACGLSLMQIVSPYLLTGLVCSLLLLGINELFNPWANHWARQFLRLQGSGRAAGANLAVNLAYKNVPGRRIWRITNFDPRPAASYEMRAVSLVQRRPDGSEEFRMDAERARWINGHWWFENVETRYFNPDNQPAGPIESAPSLEMTMLAETPQDFINEIKESNERSARDIVRFLETHQGISRDKQTRLLVDFHYRLATPWLCLIVMMLGFPLGAHSGRRGMGLGILLALLAFFGYYILMGIGLAYGKRQLISPALAGWLPVLTFFLLGLVLLRRVR